MYNKQTILFVISLLWLAFYSQGSETVNKDNEMIDQTDAELQLMGNHFFTFNTVVRINQIETSRTESHGQDESSIHTPGCPGVPRSGRRGLAGSTHDLVV